jgi:spatzle-processing enzyme
VAVEEVILHEKYLPLSLNQHNDIALLRLSRNIQFNEIITPICLPQNKLKATDIIGQTLTVAGFGRTENSPSSSIKLQVNLKVVGNDACDRTYRIDRRRLNETQFCAGGVKNEDTCKGK